MSKTYAWTFTAKPYNPDSFDVARHAYVASLYAATLAQMPITGELATLDNVVTHDDGSADITFLVPVQG